MRRPRRAALASVSGPILHSIHGTIRPRRGSRTGLLDPRDPPVLQRRDGLAADSDQGWGSANPRRRERGTVVRATSPGSPQAWDLAGSKAQASARVRKRRDPRSEGDGPATASRPVPTPLSLDSSWSSKAASRRADRWVRPAGGERSTVLAARVRQALRGPAGPCRFCMPKRRSCLQSRCDAARSAAGWRGQG